MNVFDPKPQLSSSGIQFSELESVVKEATVFIAVPIRSFENVVRQIAPKLEPGTTIIDVCSVKKYPVEIMEKYLPTSVNIVATHPMFGPDSYLSANTLNMMMSPIRVSDKIYKEWKNYFSGQNVRIIEISPDEHDRLAAHSQGITHLLGRTLRQFGIKRTSIDTEGFRDLLDLVNQTCNDSQELFLDLQSYNPYTQQMIQQFSLSLEQIVTKIRNKS